MYTGARGEFVILRPRENELSLSKIRIVQTSTRGGEAFFYHHACIQLS